MYPKDLEQMPDLEGLSEWVHTFDLFKGKNMDDDESESIRVTAKFKVRITVIISLVSPPKPQR